MSGTGPELRPGQAVGLRREAFTVLLLATVLLNVAAAAGLAAYRASLDGLDSERARERERLVLGLAHRVARGEDPISLRTETPALVRLEVRRQAPEPMARRDASTDEVVTALDGGFLIANFDRGELARQRSRLHKLTPVLLIALVSGSVLLLLYLRRLVLPYDRLLASASNAGLMPSADEIDFLVRTFEQALRERPPGASEPDPPAQDLEALQRVLAPSLPSGFLLFGPEGSLIGANEPARIMLAGALPAGLDLADFARLQPEVGDAVREAIVRAEPARHRSVTLRREDGERRLLLDIHPLLPQGSERPKGFVVLFADTSQVSRQEERLRLDDSLRRLGEISAGVAHEFRNGLATVRGYAELLARRPGIAGEETVAMRQEIEHLERVVADLLTFARPGSARVEEFDLMECLQRACADPALQHPVRLDGPASLWLAADPLLIERAVRNLLRNAAEASRRAKTREPIEVHCASTPDNIVLCVADRGPGLPPEIAADLGRPFVSARPGGVGLGLAIALRVSALHNGSLTWENRPDGGASFCLRLPPALVRPVTELSPTVT
jgi:signal transduction histidine kinase